MRPFPLAMLAALGEYLNIQRGSIPRSYIFVNRLADALLDKTPKRKYISCRLISCKLRRLVGRIE